MLGRLSSCRSCWAQTLKWGRRHITPVSSRSPRLGGKQFQKRVSGWEGGMKWSRVEAKELVKHQEMIFSISWRAGEPRFKLMQRTDLLWRGKSNEGNYYLQDPILFLSCSLTPVQWASSLELEYPALAPSNSTSNTDKPAPQAGIFLTSYTFEIWNGPNSNAIAPPDRQKPNQGLVLLTPPSHPLYRDCSLLGPRRITADPSQSCGASAKGTKAKAVVGKRPLFQTI